MITLLCDAAWTQYRKFKAGVVDNPQCIYCGGGEREDVGHVLYDCPRWEALRAPIAGWIAELKSPPAAAAYCLMCPQQAHDDLKTAWNEIQSSLARLWHARQASNIEPPMQRGRLCRGMDGGAGHEIVRWGEGMIDQTEPLHLPLCLKLVTGVDGSHVTWPSTRRQWHQLCQFLTRLRLAKVEEEDNLPPTSLLELTLAYIRANGGDRFHSGIPDGDGGGMIGVQMNQMAMGMLAAQKLLGLPEIVPYRRTQAAKSSWGARSGMAPQLLLRRPVWLPDHSGIVGMVEAMGVSWTVFL